jgi:hypothetical protein
VDDLRQDNAAAGRMSADITDSERRDRSWDYAACMMAQGHAQTPDEELSAFLDGMVAKFAHDGRPMGRIEWAQWIAENAYRVGFLS